MRLPSLRQLGLTFLSLGACALASAAQLTVAWDDNSTSETGFKIERSTDSVTFAVVATVPADTTSWTDTSVASGVAYAYRVAAFDPTSTSTYSNVASYTVPVSAIAPTILSQPQSQIVKAGSSLMLAVTASGTPSPTFQWFHDGLAVSGANSSTLTISSAAVTDAGSYTVVVSNSAGSITSNAATVTVTVPPLFTVQPVSQTAQLQGSVTFTVAATGSPTPTLQWRKDGIAIVGATSASLTLTALTDQSAGTYTVVATNSAGSAVSSGALLTVVGVCPAIVTQPSSQTAIIGQNVSFSVVASGVPAPSYQWRKNGVALTGASSATLNLVNVSSLSTGSYSVAVTNSAGSVISADATLSVTGTAPYFLQQPANQSAAEGQSVTFAVNVAGVPAPTLQWYKDAVALAGATAMSLTLSNVSAADAGSYSVVATNSAGTAKSSTATLTISTIGKLASISAQAISAPWGSAALQMSFAINTGTKSMLVRAVGPGLAPYTTATLFADPILQVLDGTTLIVSNDNWGGGTTLVDTFARVGAFPLPSASKDAALVTTLPASTINAVISGKTSGTALIEVYDADSAPAASRLKRLSARASVGKGSAALTASFVITGDTSVHLLIRAIGPSLTGLPDVLTNPKLEIYKGTTLVAQNDNWGGGAALTAAFKTAGATPLPAKSKDAAIDLTLPAGIYSAVITPANTDTGLAQIEFFTLP